MQGSIGANGHSLFVLAKCLTVANHSNITTLNTDPILQSFELAAERAGDITHAVYTAYFARCPESQQLMRDTDQHMRGRMMESVLLLLMADSIESQIDYLRYETRQHQSFGVLRHMYNSLLTATRDTVRDAVEKSWTSAMDAAWAERLNAVQVEIDRALESKA